MSLQNSCQTLFLQLVQIIIMSVCSSELCRRNNSANCYGTVLMSQSVKFKGILVCWHEFAQTLFTDSLVNTICLGSVVPHSSPRNWSRQGSSCEKAPTKKERKKESKAWQTSIAGYGLATKREDIKRTSNICMVWGYGLGLWKGRI
jgi:hypothetical protein